MNNLKKDLELTLAGQGESEALKLQGYNRNCATANSPNRRMISLLGSTRFQNILVARIMLVCISLAHSIVAPTRAEQSISTSQDQAQLDKQAEPRGVIFLEQMAGKIRDLTRMGRLEEAIEAWTQVLEQAKQELGSEHFVVSKILDAIGKLHMDSGNYTEAEVLYRQSLLIGSKYSDSRDRANIGARMNNLGLALLNQGKFQDAVEILEESLASTKATNGEKDVNTSAALINLGQAYAAQGRIELAAEKTTKGLEIANSKRDLDLLAIGTNNLAQIQGLLGDPKKEQQLLEKALELMITVYGKDDLNVARSLLRLANFAKRYGGQEYTHSMLTRAWQIAEKQPERGSDIAAMAMAGLGELYFAKKNYQMAVWMQLTALEIYKTKFGSHHPEFATGLSNLSEIFYAQGRKDLAEQALDQATLAQSKWLTQELPLLPSGLRSIQLAQVGENLINKAFSFIGTSNRADNLALLLRINRHGLLQEIERRQARAIRSSSEARRYIEEIQSLKVRRSSLASSKLEKEALGSEIDKKEAYLIRMNPGLKPDLYTVEDIRRLLPNNAVLIEFQKFLPATAPGSESLKSKESEYAAIALMPDGTTRTINLGPSVVIDVAIKRALDAISQNASDSYGLLSEVGGLVVAPLLKEFSDIGQWYVTPDSEIHRIPFAALPIHRASTKSIGQVVSVRVLTSARDLVWLQRSSAKSNQPVVLANPNFNYRRKSNPNDVARHARTREFDGLTWAPLPESEVEAMHVAALLGARVATGNDASASYLRNIDSPRILHIASHGFFLEAQEGAGRSIDVFTTDGSFMQSVRQSGDPMMRSGVVLSGANHPFVDPAEDGYLTAAEVLDLELSGTEMVVLSACSTGRGDIQSGEGLYGLQRSLTVAGSRSTLLSLWKVDDEATVEFMERFYTRLKAGEGRSDALAATQREFRDGTAGNGQWKDPYYWAAWQLVGDWRPIQGL